MLYTKMICTLLFKPVKIKYAEAPRAFKFPFLFSRAIFGLPDNEHPGDHVSGEPINWIDFPVAYLFPKV